MIRSVQKYVHHVRRQSHAMREVHAVLFATVLTLLFIFLYLYIGSVSSDKDVEGKPVLSTEFASPFSLFMDQIKGAFSRVKDDRSFEIVNQGESTSTGADTKTSY